ncbi:MAG TPA: SprB repeat-containing protein, partial [Saprospiraceae bacterium]|nr:SprB repeat-containing protein [Saprospiraceae bacterium]
MPIASLRLVRFLLMTCLSYGSIASVSAQCPSPPVVTAPASIMLCSNQNLMVVFSGTAGATFNWTNNNPGIGIPGAGSGNINTPVITVLTTQVATFTVTPQTAPDCIGTPVTFTVTVSPGTAPPIPGDTTMCRFSPLLTLPTSPGGVTGNWSGIGVVNNVFNPMVSSGDLIQLLFVPNPGQCAVPATRNITFFPELLFFIGSFPGPYCEVSGPVPLTGIIQPTGTPGTWSGPGVLPGNIFDPSLAGGGFHDISFTTAEACPVEVFFNIEVMDASTPQFDIVGPYCPGDTPTVLPGTSNDGFTGTWSPAVIDTDMPGNTIYTFTPTDGQGCIDEAVLNIVVQSPPTLTCAQQNPVTVTGGSDGSATVQISGGTPGYTIAWSGPVSGSQIQSAEGTATITNLMAGNYTVTVTDMLGCEQTCTFTIGDPGCNILLAATGSNPLCTGASNGSIALTVSNSSGTLVFDWSNNTLDGQQNPSGLIAGTYSVTVTDGANCNASTSVTLSDPAAIALTCAQQNPVTTVGGSNGSATVMITGGTAGYTVAWSGPSSGSQNQAAAGTATITGLSAGNYTVTVTDQNNCSQTCTFTIAGPVCNLAINAQSTPPSCFGGNNGSIVLSVSNANGALSFDWNVNALDGIQNPTGLTAGVYFVTVTDAAGCTTNTPVSISSPAQLNLVCAQQSPVTTIGGNQGVASIQILGGTAGYTIAWSGPASGSRLQPTPGPTTITGLVAGDYSVTVTDSRGCTRTCTFTIAAANCNMTLTINGINPTCNGNTNGSITLTVTNSTGNVTYDWSDNTLDGIQNPTGLAAGTFSVTVSDEAGCVRTGSVTLNNPPALSLTCSQQNPVTTVGGMNGSATVNISGGTPGYTIEWSGPSSGSNTSSNAGATAITALQEGSYTVTVTDNNGCMQTCAFVISGPGCMLAVSAGSDNPLCNGSSDGEITLTLSGAAGSTMFDWNDNSLDGTQNPTGLAAGTYAVTVTDGAGCTATTSVTLNDPPALVLTCAQTAPASTVSAADGTAEVQINGGTPFYTIAWSGPVNGSQMQSGMGTASISGLPAGDYSVTVTDVNNCSQTCMFTISGPICDIVLDAQPIHPNCPGSTDGAVTLTVSNATGMLSFDWSDDAVDGIQNPDGLIAGSYTVIVEDALGCTATSTILLNDPAPIVLICSQLNPTSTVTGSDGAANIQISGGTAGYSIAWSGAASGSQNLATAGTATINGLVMGNYVVTATDANDCESVCNFSIAGPVCNLTLSISGTDPICNGAATGSIDLTVTGGSGALTFDWNVNALDGTEDPTNLLAGTYAVTVTDAIGCQANTSVTLTNPAAITLICAQQNPVTVINGSNGSATVQISGGGGGYTITWSGPVSGSQTQSVVGTATITGLQAGTYNVTVSDFTGCQQTCSFMISGPVCNISLNITGTSPSCNGGNNGSIALVVNNANGAASFDWNVNALDGIQNPANLPAGTYQVTVTDAAGCTANTTVTLNDPPALTLACAQQNPVSAVGGSDGSATVQISGGTAGYTIAWSGPANGSQNQAAAGTATITGLIAGSYTIIITDARGCTQTCSFSIGDPNCNITVDAILTHPLCNGSQDGSIQLIINNGTGNLSFEWNLSVLDGIQNPAGLGAGNYSVLVTDELNCTATASAILTAPSPILLNCAQQNPVSTMGGSNGSATVQISGGTATYTIAWSGAASGSQNQATAGTATITGLIAGTYNVIVTDANGCEQTCNFSISSPACALDVA